LNRDADAPNGSLRLARRRRLELLLEVVDHLVDDGAGRRGAVLPNSPGLARNAGHELGATAQELDAADEFLH